MSVQCKWNSDEIVDFIRQGFCFELLAHFVGNKFVSIIIALKRNEYYDSSLMFAIFEIISMWSNHFFHLAYYSNGAILMAKYLPNLLWHRRFNVYWSVLRCSVCRNPSAILGVWPNIYLFKLHSIHLIAFGRSKWWYLSMILSLADKFSGVKISIFICKWNERRRRYFRFRMVHSTSLWHNPNEFVKQFYFSHRMHKECAFQFKIVFVLMFHRIQLRIKKFLCSFAQLNSLRLFAQTDMLEMCTDTYLER